MYTKMTDAEIDSAIQMLRTPVFTTEEIEWAIMWWPLIVGATTFVIASIIAFVVIHLFFSK